MSVRIVDSLPELGGQLTALYPEKFVYDMPGFPKVLARDLAAEMAVQGTAFGPDLVLNETCSELVDYGDYYDVVTASGRRLPTRCVVIAAGAGAFTPTKVGASREDEFVGKGLSYGVRDKSSFAGKRVGIVGGGDSALDWCCELEPIAESVTLIHRRDQFRAHEETVQKVRNSTVAMKLWCTVVELTGDGELEGVVLENTQTKEREALPLDALVVNVGFKSSLGPLKEWGLEIDKTQIVVSPTTYETNRMRVYAVGDVATYEGKLKLIATGVGEAVTAVCYAKQTLDPEAKLFPGHSSDRDL